MLRPRCRDAPSLLLGWVIVVLLSWGGAGEAAPSQVLVLYGYARLLPAVALFDQTLRDELGSDADTPVEISSEYLNLAQFGSPEYEKALLAMLESKYGAGPPDLVVAGGEQALAFLLSHRTSLYRDRPIVHAAVDRAFLAGQPIPAHVVGIPVDYDPISTITLAARLHPRARRLVLVTGASGEFDRPWETRLRGLPRTVASSLEREFLAGHPMPEIEARLKNLPPDSIVFTPGLVRDGAGRAFTPRQSLARMAGATDVPIYGPYDTFVGAGAVGGHMPTFEQMARGTAGIIRRLLRGGSTAELALAPALPRQYIFDWREIERHGISESALPPGSVIRFRGPTFWEAYRGSVLLTAAVVSVQGLVIAFLLVERRRRRRTAAQLREAEQRLTLAAEAAGVRAWAYDAAANRFWGSLNPRLSPPAGADSWMTLDRALASVHPADQAAVRRSIAQAATSGEDLDIQFRFWGTREGEAWVMARARIAGPADTPAATLVGVSADITERRTTEAELQRQREQLVQMNRLGMLGQLSASLAHELNQPLAAILANAQAAQRMLGQGSADLAETREILADIVSEDRRAAEILGGLRSLFAGRELALRPADANTLVLGVVRLLEGELSLRGVCLAQDLASSLWPVAADSVQIQQVLLNLIINAADAMATTDAADRVLTLRTRQVQAEGVEIAVIDRGKGMTDEAIARAAEPFYTTKPEGMGMGLAISRAILAAHGAGLTAGRNPDRGMTFSFVLRRAEGEGS